MANKTSDGRAASQEEQKRSGRNLSRNVTLGIAALFAILLVLFGIALLLGTAGGESFAAAIKTIRDLMIIFLVLEGVLIILALAILILQIARLVSLLQTEIKPMLENTQSTVSTVRGTVDFMSANLTEPIVKAGGFLSGAATLARELFGLRRALRHAQEERAGETIS